MRVLALNCGSSSLKSALIDTTDLRCLQEMRIENIGSSAVRLQVGAEVSELADGQDLAQATDRLLSEYRQRFAASAAPEAVVHRVVHGGEKFQGATLIDASMLTELEQLSELAPLHNPPALMSIQSARAALPDVPHVASFDTAFHATLPEHAREYALPADVRRRFGIRRFGFHGINHSHVAQSVAAFLKAEPQALRIVSCHLGNGASVTAIEAGRSVDTSMGMTPLEGLVMGTRAGDIDPGVMLRLQRPDAFRVDELDELLNKRAGLKGLTGFNDIRDIEQRAQMGDVVCKGAIDIYVHRVRKYIGAFAAVMGGVDVIAFTGGVGEHRPLIRHRCLERFEFLGASLDTNRNDSAELSAARPVVSIGADSSRVKLLVVRANEELQMAQEAAWLLGGQ